MYILGNILLIWSSEEISMVIRTLVEVIIVSVQEDRLFFDVSVPK